MHEKVVENELVVDFNVFMLVWIIWGMIKRHMWWYGEMVVWPKFAKCIYVDVFKLKMNGIYVGNVKLWIFGELRKEKCCICMCIC